MINTVPKSAQVAPESLKTLVIMSTITLKKSSVGRKTLEKFWKSVRKPGISKVCNKFMIDDSFFCFQFLCNIFL